ncbi:MAG: hypothetical protein M1832_000635 [Thelocarpon impressellum]|nr:MAG: hypothetical protein M1832_000635 [Thelocarpon impressellum]
MATSPRFFSQPLRYLHWASLEKPAIFYSILIGSLGPVFVVAVPPLRRRFGDGPREPIPLTYPIPRGPRKIPQGYDDPE